jgi:hypothetical protein
MDPLEERFPKDLYAWFDVDEEEYYLIAQEDPDRILEPIVGIYELKAVKKRKVVFEDLD